MGDNGENIVHVCTGCRNRVTLKPPNGPIQVLIPPGTVMEVPLVASQYGKAHTSQVPAGETPKMKYERQMAEAGH